MPNKDDSEFAEHFITSFGALEPQSAFDITTDLANQSLAHALTCKDTALPHALTRKDTALDSTTTTIDTTKAGAVNVQFGIGSTASIGSIIVEADTPFLFCLKDMDTLGVG